MDGVQKGCVSGRQKQLERSAVRRDQHPCSSPAPAVLPRRVQQRGIREAKAKGTHDSVTRVQVHEVKSGPGANGCGVPVPGVARAFWSNATMAAMVQLAREGLWNLKDVLQSQSEWELASMPRTHTVHVTLPSVLLRRDRAPPPHCQPSARIAWSKDAGSAARLATRNAETSASLAPSAGQAHLIAPVRTVAANTVQHSKHQDTYWRRPPCICAERVDSHSFPPRFVAGQCLQR